MSARPDRVLSLLLVPEHGRPSRTWRVSYRHLRFLAAGFSGVALILALMAGSWWFLAVRSIRVGMLEARVEELEAEKARILRVAEELEALEARYEAVRVLVAGPETGAAAGIRLPPLAAGVRPESRGTGPVSGGAPSEWPLTERGFITQRLFAGSEGGTHPGVDIAIPAGSYIRAAGAGFVSEARMDEVYGNFIVLDHPSGHRSLYAHASLLLVAPGDTVEAGEVIGLTGSTGRSTAPHLHFEIQEEGRTVDPLLLVRRP